MDKALLDKVMQLDPADRVELARRLWENVPDAGDDFVLTNEQKAEIDRRIAEHEGDPGGAIPVEEVRDWLSSRRK
jgi:putative addiction module component (TIGR02574 family)